MSKLFYTAKDVSDLFGIHKNTILRYAKKGKIESQLLVGRYIFTKESILRYAKKNIPEYFKEVEKKLC